MTDTEHTTRQHAAALRAEVFAALEGLAEFLVHRLQHGQAVPPSARGPLPSTLTTLAARLDLSRFEQDVLLLSAAPELDARFRTLIAEAHGDPAKPWLTFKLALTLFSSEDWEAITPVARLRRWQLLELIGGGPALEARLQVDECILHQLLGMAYPDPRLAPWMALESFHREVRAPLDSGVEHLARTWQAAESLGQTHVARLSGGDGEAYARAIALGLGLELYRLVDSDLPSAAHEREQLIRLWERQSRLRGALLWVDTEPSNPEGLRRLGAFLDSLESLIVVTGLEGLKLRRPQHRSDTRDTDAADRLSTWQASVGARGAGLNGKLSALAEQFQLPRAAIQRLGQGWATSPNGTPAELWSTCRVEARRGLEDLAERVECCATWDDLVLPSASLQGLRAIAAQVRQRTRVHRDWGFAERGGRGLGISALFAGSSGTGKTLAAEVLATELELDLYRIDLSALMSKYIGETEKNLAQVFVAAERSGAILLFDEADALFGKRSEVRDSHDRYANLEVSYLLQRIETYRGVAILTSNLKQTLDSAFQRRLRFIIDFPFPDVDARGAIWSRVFPKTAPLSGIAFAKLSRLSLSGGHIRNLALNAAFLAADEQSAVKMEHLRRAAEAEFAKLERPLPLSDVRDWQ